MSAHISADFVNRYVDKTPPWGFGGLGEIVYLRTYSRDGETWPQTLQRCVNGAIEIGADLSQDEAETMFDHMFNLRASLSGRSLWQLGTPLVQKFNGTSLNNCVSYETRMLTSDGVRQIGDLAGETAIVMDGNSKWVEAEIRSFGEQELMKVIMTRGGTKKVVYATPGHRWFTYGESANEEWTTDTLPVGKYLVSVFGQGISSVRPSAFGIAHGIVFGDGTRNGVGGASGTKVLLCGEKNAPLLKWFPNSQSRDVWRNGKHVGVEVVDLPKAFKDKPVLTESKSYLYGWLAGYFAADGCVAESGQMTMASAKRENLEFVRDVCYRLGIGTHPIRVQERIGINGVESDIFTITFMGEMFTEDFFLIQTHAERWAAKHGGSHGRTVPQRTKRGWKVVSVEKTDRFEEVYCAVVPTTHSFVLEDNLLTGNCYFVNIEHIEDFEMLFDYLMLGGGVGFSVERSKIHDLPKVKHGVSIVHERTNDADIIVPDSRQGWRRLLHAVLKSFFETGKSFTYSTILIREFGAPLKTFGGTASGPGALIDGVNDICKVMQAREGKKLRSVDVLDICNIIGRIVVSGSSRRSAQIAIGDPDDILFLRAKNWGSGNVPGWRANSNNSIYADSFDQILPELWKGYDGSGEPYGLLNRKLARTYGRIGEKKADPSIEGYNPCVTGDTWVHTDQGPRRVIELLDDPYVALVNGKPYQATAFWETGVKPVLSVQTSEGYVVRATADHKILTPDGWVEAGLLEPGDQIVLHDHLGASWDGPGSEDEGYILGHLVGDGTFYPDQTPAVAVWTSDSGHEGPKARLQRIMEALPHRSDWNGWRPVADTGQFRMKHVGLRDLAYTFGICKGVKTITEEVEASSSAFHVGFLRGLFDTDGHVEGETTGGGVSIRLSQSDREMLCAAQRMLLRLGIKSSIRMMHEAGIKSMPGGEYQTKQSFRLIISGQHAQRFMSVIGFENAEKTTRWESKTDSMRRGFYVKPMTAVVIDVVSDGTEMVYDCTVEDVHAFDANGIYVHNCAEIALADGESCNLATIFLPNVDSYEQFLEISKLLYKVQKAITSLSYPYDKTNNITKKNRRLGQSITGILQCSEEQLSWLSSGYEALRDYDKEYSAAHGVPESVRLTTVQPSGTLSLLPGVTPGIHPAFAPFYIRRVRFSTADPLVDGCRKRGYNVVPEIGIDGREDHTKWVVEFPCKSPENAVLAKNMTAVEQLEWVKWSQKEWADNAVSVTVYYRKEELPEIKEWLAVNYDDTIKSVSFLLHSDHNFPLPPYEEIDEATYNKMLGKIDFSVALRHSEDTTIIDESCATGACPIR